MAREREREFRLFWKMNWWTTPVDFIPDWIILNSFECWFGILVEKFSLGFNLARGMVSRLD